MAVQIDVTQHPELAGQYGADTVPRDVVVYPNGHTETLHIGFVPRTQYLSMLTRIRDEGDRIRIQNQPKPEESQTTNENKQPETAQPSTTDSIESETEQALLLGWMATAPLNCTHIVAGCEAASSWWTCIGALNIDLRTKRVEPSFGETPDDSHRRTLAVTR